MIVKCIDRRHPQIEAFQWNPNNNAEIPPWFWTFKDWRVASGILHVCSGSVLRPVKPGSWILVRGFELIILPDEDFRATYQIVPEEETNPCT